MIIQLPFLRKPGLLSPCWQIRQCKGKIQGHKNRQGGQVHPPSESRDGGFNVWSPGSPWEKLEGWVIPGLWGLRGCLSLCCEFRAPTYITPTPQPIPNYDSLPSCSLGREGCYVLKEEKGVSMINIHDKNCNNITKHGSKKGKDKEKREEQEKINKKNKIMKEGGLVWQGSVLCLFKERNELFLTT